VSLLTQGLRYRAACDNRPLAASTSPQKPPATYTRVNDFGPHTDSIFRVATYTRVYTVILVPNSMSKPSAFSSKNISSQVIASRTTLCTLFFSRFKKLGSCGYPSVKEWRSWLLIQYQRVTNRRTDVRHSCCRPIYI